MKIATTMAALLILGTVAGPMAAAAGDGREADHEALRALRAKAETALSQQDMKALAPCLAKEFVITTVDQSRFTNMADLTAYYDSMFKAKDARLSAMSVSLTADALTHFTDANTGYCTGTSKDTYTLKRNGEKITFDSRWTAVVVKEDGEWKLAALHCGVNFLDNPLYSVNHVGFWRSIGRFLHLCD